MTRSFLTRRIFIAGLGLGVTGVALAACVSSAPAATPAPAAPAAVAPTAATPSNATTPAEAAPTTTSALAAAAAPAASVAPKTKVSGPINWLVRTSPEENSLQETIFEPLIKTRLPTVTVTRIVVPADKYIPKINSMAAADESLEIWGFGGNYYDYWVRYLPQNLDSYVSGDKWDIGNYFLSGLSDVYNIHGHQYGLPQLTCYGSNLVYNKNLFDAVGIKYPTLDWDDKTWNMDAFVANAVKLTKNAGAPDATYGASVTLWDRMTSLSYLWGGDSWLPEHYTNFIAPKTNFNGEANVQSHQWRHDLIYEQKVHPDPATDQSLNQFADPFKTGKIAMVLDGGWQLWSTSGITKFKVGVAPVPWFKTNKSIIFDDFWIMGRWAKNKDGAWAVMRVLTSVAATTKYSVQSGTPPTPRQSTDPWAKTRADFFGVSLDEMKTMLAQSIDKRVQESPDHLFLGHPKIDDTYNNEIAALWNHSDATAAGVMPAVTKVMDQTVLDIYNQFKNSMPRD